MCDRLFSALPEIFGTPKIQTEFRYQLISRLFRLSPLLQSRLDPLRSERDLAQSNSGRVENCVADGRGYHRDGCLARARGLFIWVLEKHDLALGKIATDR